MLIGIYETSFLGYKRSKSARYCIILFEYFFFLIIFLNYNFFLFSLFFFKILCNTCFLFLFYHCVYTCKYREQVVLLKSVSQPWSLSISSIFARKFIKSYGQSNKYNITSYNGNEWSFLNISTIFDRRITLVYYTDRYSWEFWRLTSY